MPIKQPASGEDSDTWRSVKSPTAEDLGYEEVTYQELEEFFGIGV